MASSNGLNKAKVWLAVTYPENMVEDWKEQAADLLQGIPFAYCVHDQDQQGHVTKDPEQMEFIETQVISTSRKVHVHWILYLKDIKDGTTTRKHATDIINLLSLPGRRCAPPCEACLNIEHAWNYLIHDTEGARKAGKHLYPAECRKTGNTFDIERYIRLSAEQKLEMARELCDYVANYRIKDMYTLYLRLSSDFDESYFQIYKENNALLDRLCRGVFNDMMRGLKVVEAPKCGICGNPHVAGSYQSESGRLWFCMDCQETAYNILMELEEDEGDGVSRNRPGDSRQDDGNADSE